MRAVILHIIYAKESVNINAGGQKFTQMYTHVYYTLCSDDPHADDQHTVHHHVYSLTVLNLCVHSRVWPPA